MMNVDDVERTLHEELDDVEAIPQSFTRRSWDTSTTPELYGWSWPELTEEGYVVKFCPEVVHQAMSVLPPDMHADYINAVVASLHLHIAFTDEIEDPIERSMAVDAYLHERASGSVDLLSSVQLAALDSQQ